MEAVNRILSIQFLLNYFSLILSKLLKVMDNILLYNKLINLPENMKSEVSDFIDFLLSKAQKSNQELEKPKAKFGSAKGMFTIKDDFDQPLDDFNEYMN